MNGYNLFGLKLNSKIILRDFPRKKAYNNPHATLEFGKVNIPNPDSPNTNFTPFYIYNNSLYVHIIPKIAKYEIRNRTKVTINLASKQKKDAALFFFFDTILPILLLTNDFYPIHASAVLSNNGVHLFSSPRGDGKSTLAAGLSLRGYKFISDDICILKWDKDLNQFKTKCFHSKIHLWATSFSIFNNINKKINAKPIRKGIKKFTIDFNQFACKQFNPVKSINIINVKNEDVAPEVNPMKGIPKMVGSKNMIHSNKIAAVVAKDQLLFKYSGLLAKNMIMNNVVRSRLTKISDFSKFISDEVLTETTNRI